MLVKSRVFKSVQLIMAFAVMIGVAMFALPSSASAQSAASNTLKVSPVRSDVSVKPGEKGVVKITVTNLTNEEIVVRPIQNDFISGDEKGTPSIILDADQFAPTHSLKRFLAPLQDIRIPANKSKIVEVTITVPATTQAGGYFGAIRFAPANPGSGGQVNTNASVASLILLTVPGDAVEKLNLTEFMLLQGGKEGGGLLNSPNDLKMTLRFENKGNVQLGPFGKVSVTQGDKVIYDTDFNNKTPSDVILPDSARRWDLPLENIGSFGHYTVSATFTYGTKNQSIDVTRSFWVIPMAVIIGAAIMTLLLIALIVWFIFHLKNRRTRQVQRRSTGRLR